MRELHYFNATGNPEISVAQVGRSYKDWTAVEKETPISHVIDLMAEYRFDVIPIREPDDSFISCYKTNTWGNYSPDNIHKTNIESGHKLYYLTSIQDTIAQFAKTNNYYFFLDNLSEVIGIVTISDLNCKHVYLYLYNKIIQLEHAMKTLVYGQQIKDEDIIAKFNAHLSSGNIQEDLDRYNKDRQMGLDLPFLEYIHLIDFKHIIREFDLSNRLGLSFNKFKEKLGEINEIRKKVAHPAKSLVSDAKSLQSLQKTMEALDELLEKLFLLQPVH